MGKALRRGSNQAVRKTDIRVVPNTSAGAAVKPTFTAASSNYHEYFTSMCAAELDLATVYARVPLHEHSLMKPNGIADMSKRLKTLQQGMGAVKGLEDMRGLVKQRMNKYAGAVGGVHRELDELALLQATLDAEVAKDPFIVRLEIEALLNELVMAEQARIRDLEPQLIERLKVIVGGYMELLGSSGRQLRQTAKAGAKANVLLDECAEWAYFAETFQAVLATEQRGGRRWIKVQREGVVALKEQGPMFRSTWQSKYCVLTARGYFHVFRSQGDVAKCAPETSVFLPTAQVSLVRAGTLQIRSGSKTGRTSLELWRTLMQRARSRNPAGMATPESSEDEMPGTQNLYMLPLENTPACSLDAPIRRPFSCISPMVNISELSFEANSPGISDFPVPSPRLSIHTKDGMEHHRTESSDGSLVWQGRGSIVPLQATAYGDGWPVDLPEAARSLVHSERLDPALMDPHNPYLGDLFAKSTRVSSVGCQNKGWRSSVQKTARVASQPVVGATSPPLPVRMLGPCVSRDCIDECEEEG
ncbi:hypothetical protein DL89DRAFT_269343 [Linderina pennispora]|uniref:SLM1/RGC1-like PH domain-containing protein n=1 Tax=Linderina pennispora TaxID=61395 RepID=A0A1Y1W321_9FUNG|nr:uncharacterized protein DL89DRAFT_269343 [Linderina pennispora]ORX67544.1 hypothetical protein DL89DRAFT_269343 [Linderina pennispora]